MSDFMHGTNGESSKADHITNASGAVMNEETSKMQPGETAQSAMDGILPNTQLDNYGRSTMDDAAVLRVTSPEIDMPDAPPIAPTDVTPVAHPSTTEVTTGPPRQNQTTHTTEAGPSTRTSNAGQTGRQTGRVTRSALASQAPQQSVQATPVIQDGLVVPPNALILMPTQINDGTYYTMYAIAVAAARDALPLATLVNVRVSSVAPAVSREETPVPNAAPENNRAPAVAPPTLTIRDPPRFLWTGRSEHRWIEARCCPGYDAKEMAKVYNRADTRFHKNNTATKPHHFSEGNIHREMWTEILWEWRDHNRGTAPDYILPDAFNGIRDMLRAQYNLQVTQEFYDFQPTLARRDIRGFFTQKFDWLHFIDE
ncbi:hypothetical protein M426DRAFT_261622 [Hypoxylon sp. CI-4A]|nr:hypothetical protein M426DRAFT_261622 [Hypoxylon sp. CI-4A]